MCRLLAYLGPPIRLDRLIVEPEHSLVEQSYKPREMTSGHVNADGFGRASAVRLFRQGANITTRCH